MSEHNNSEAARQRLLKANNVQRRRFERMADEFAERAKQEIRNIEREHRKVVQRSLLEEAIGKEKLGKLIELRNQLLMIKEAKRRVIDEMKRMAVELRQVGVTTNYGFNQYYLDPEEPNDNDHDVCRDPNERPDVEAFTIQQCRGNDLYAKYERKLLQDNKKDELENDILQLRANVWSLVTTDDITEAIMNFRNKWL